MADRKISDLTALTTPAAGDYLPIIDISEPLAANKNKRITIEELLRGAPDGTAGAPGFAFESDPDSGLYRTGENGVALSTGGTGRLFVDASGKVGVGTASPSYVLDVLGSARVKTGATATPFIISTGGDTQGTVRFGSASTEYSINGGADYLGLIFNSNGSERLRITSTGQLSHIGAGSSGSPAVSFNGSAPSNSLVIDSSGRAGLGTASPGALLHLAQSAADAVARIDGGSSNTAFIDFRIAGANKSYVGLGGLTGGSNNDLINYNSSAGNWIAYTNGSPRMYITSAGNVGIGTTSPSDTLQINKTGAGGVKVVSTTQSTIYFSNAAETGGYLIGRSIGSNNAHNLFSYDVTNSHYVDYFEGGSGGYRSLYTNGTERARIDSSGRLLVGTSTARSNFYNSSVSALIQSEEAGANQALYSLVSNSNTSNGPALVLGKTRGTTVGSTTIIQNGDCIGEISFQGMDGAEFVNGATVRGEIDGTPGANDLPTRLVFSTTADGASSPTERMRIINNGSILIGKTVDNNSDQGINIGKTGFLSAVRVGGPPIYVNRLVDDGVLVEFAQDSIIEGTISVSGTTVSYNGAHLSRWSQLPSGAERTEILRGSVLSNIDEMCEWGDEDNEQLNRMKVSDVEGDKNVSGVFQAWDDDDDTYVNDFYCAMTGDFIIRIGAGVTVERGDLLMSAGDGTAKPQDDDIIRSKTIAKVTSTNVSCTYDDGSYCVPCVLMAC